MVFEKIREILVDQLGVEEGEVTLEASFIDDLSADSLDEFGIEVAEEDVESLTTVGAAVEYIKSHTNG